jgi:hypothetical protein
MLTAIRPLERPACTQIYHRINVEASGAQTSTTASHGAFGVSGVLSGWASIFRSYWFARRMVREKRDDMTSRLANSEHLVIDRCAGFDRRGIKTLGRETPMGGVQIINHQVE